MDQRRWEDLDVDCLLIVLGRVGMESLLLGVPFVCKSWYKASLDPSFWQCLILPDFHDGFMVARFSYFAKNQHWIATPFYRKFIRQYRISKYRFSMTGFVKLVVSRSRGNATSLSLPECSNRLLRLVANTCPSLKALSLPRNFVLRQSSIIMELTEKLKHLESLSLGCSTDITEILSQISLHCKNFRRLDVFRASLCKDEVLSIVKFVPNIEYLSLRRAIIRRCDLITLLQGCRELVFLDVSGTGFDEGDHEISMFASHISNFRCKGLMHDKICGSITV
ncbi:unnamed protein product [Prunus brigantina]